MFRLHCLLCIEDLCVEQNKPLKTQANISSVIWHICNLGHEDYYVHHTGRTLIDIAKKQLNTEQSTRTLYSTSRAHHSNSIFETTAALQRSYEPEQKGESAVPDIRKPRKSELMSLSCQHTTEPTTLSKIAPEFRTASVQHPDPGTLKPSKTLKPKKHTVTLTVLGLNKAQKPRHDQVTQEI